MESTFDTIIGLEVHVELLTKSKLFCSCSTSFGNPPNTQVCPVCLGLPGVLPVVNKKAIEYLIRVALALDCRITSRSKFDRKNYFYPDMPKNYQISQYDLPLATDGILGINLSEIAKDICIKRIHLEEDTGKSTHMGTIDKSLYTLLDYNRAGVPLLEIVTEPDLRSPEEAYLFLTSLKNLLRWLAVSDCKMEEGSLRCDGNISIREKDGPLGIKTEIKNMNSFKSVKDALDFEAKRQRELVLQGKKLIQETRGWDEKNCVTIPMRSKEAEHDYRYFPDPDLLPLTIEPSWVEEIRYAQPELPEKRRERLIQDYSLPLRNAEFLTSSREMADFFEEACISGESPKTICNWLMGDISRFLNEQNISIEDSRLTPQNLRAMIKLLSDETISGKIAKLLIEEMLKTGATPEKIIEEHGWIQIKDEGALQKIVEEVVNSNPDAVSDYLSGKVKILGFLVGQVMKSTKGKANPALVNTLLLEEIKKSGERSSQE